MANPTNYTALAAECEKKAEQGEKPVLEWMRIGERDLECPVDRRHAMPVMPSNIELYWLQERDVRVLGVGESSARFDTFLSAQLFAEALLRDATKPLHQGVYNELATTKDMLNTTHGQIAEMCESLGLKREDVPCDAWTLQYAIVKACEHRDALRAENQRLRTALETIKGGPKDDPACNLVGDYKKGLFCGVEDRDITDRYDAAEFGFDAGVDRCHEWASDIAGFALYPEAPTAAPVTIESLIQPIHQWQLQTFPRATALSTALHLLEEARELVAKPSDGEEMADILMLLIGIASITGTNLTEELRRKFEKNKARKWGTPDADGVVRHVEDAPTAATPDPSKET